MNKVILIGRLTKEPDIRITPSGLTVAHYTLAVDGKFKKDGEPDADFISCVAFGKPAEFAEKYLAKGAKIAICGRIQTRSYDDKYGQKNILRKLLSMSNTLPKASETMIFLKNSWEKLRKN